MTSTEMQLAFLKELAYRKPSFYKELLDFLEQNLIITAQERREISSLPNIAEELLRILLKSKKNGTLSTVYFNWSKMPNHQLSLCLVTKHNVRDFTWEESND